MHIKDCLSDTEVIHLSISQIYVQQSRAMRLAITTPMVRITVRLFKRDFIFGPNIEINEKSHSLAYDLFFFFLDNVNLMRYKHQT